MKLHKRIGKAKMNFRDDTFLSMFMKYRFRLDCKKLTQQITFITTIF